MSNITKKINIKVHNFYDMSEFISDLVKIGYERNDQEMLFGNFSVNGGSIVVMSSNSVDPVRIDFFGNEIDSIISFDQQTGKKKIKYEEIIFYPNVLSLEDGSKIRIGDFVVHEDYGIGQFMAIGLKFVEGENIEYIYLNYLNNQQLFLPISLKNKLSSYIGVGHRKPKLNKLGSNTWQKTFSKTYENVLLMAKELLKIYAEREISVRDSWVINNDWEQEIKSTFPYRETDDQISAINEVFKDIVSNKPIDRLICGDVGFGKTEVAIRAAAQAAANGFQVVFLVPTTLLAEQHYATLVSRFKNLPVNIGKISRFSNKSEQLKTIELLESGKIDIIVGTHRLFGADIKYKNLGLLIIDEEQKFGVKQKEKLKKLKSSLNVLSLTATPIPRTLFMSLSGIRDISSISTPPLGRKEIETEIFLYDENRIRNAIEKEIDRGGQVYFLHNKVVSMLGITNKLKKMFPNLVIENAHGQMDESKLSNVMTKFTLGEIDILVCSTIIENGLDLPNANTLIVEEADHFGLSQLYQIRGRIGRSKKQAYAYFTYSNKNISNIAFKRLKALVENTELGSGYNISLSDLEIRGGGNILGREQHGNMEAVGLVLYTKLLNSAVAKLRNN